MTNSVKGVILLNMGGPDKPDDVRPFLFNLFSDREIITLGPPFLQPFIAWFIARKRGPKSQSIYAKIGGGSPLKDITQAQAAALETALSKESDTTYHTTIAMRYWPPFAEEAITDLLSKGVREITVLTLYPHYSKATTGSSINHLRTSLAKLAPEMPVHYITSWPTQPSYIRALSNNILQAIAGFGTAPVQVVYSAHSLPVSFIKDGDPYVEHIEQTIEEIEKITGHKGKLCYQSRSGPVEWLSPSTQETLQLLSQEGCKNIVMVPISFVSDHVETLYEIDILFKEEAKKLGLELRSSPSLNTDPLFIQGLQELVMDGR